MLYLILIFYILYRWTHPPKVRHVLNVYFGVPGAGKTTLAAYFTKQANKQAWIITYCEKHPGKISSWILKSKYWKRRLPVYSNVPITGAYKLDPQHDIGKYMIVNGKVIIDEAGIEYNNRSFKTFPPEAIYWYKYHRHYECSVEVFSQSHEDMDITLRRLAQNYYVVKKSLIPFCVCFRRIYRKVGIDENTHQIVDMYYFKPLGIGSKWIFSPPLWKLFNSYSRKELKEKEWEVW